MSTSSQPQSFLQLRGVTHQYGPITALREINFTLDRGDFCCVLGPNGAGKTTLLSIISTLIRPTLGDVCWGCPDWGRSRIGLVSHQTMLYEQLTGFENLLFYAQLYGLRNVRETTKTLIQKMDLTSFINRSVNSYSRGMRQRLTLARALLHKPDLLLLDEPFTGWDQHGSQAFGQVLKEITSDKRTVLMVTHNLREGCNLASRFLVLNHGCVMLEEANEALKYEDWENRYLESVSIDSVSG